jgi:glycosyltransferase involved in cell wall biosynthesis
MRHAALVTGGSHYLLQLARQQLPAAFHTRLRWAPLGVDLARFTLGQASPPGSQVAALNVGALFPVKDQALLLRALAHLPGARLRIAGAGPLREPLQAQARALGLAGRVEFLGAVEHHHLPALYAAAGVFVQTSRHEAQGMALLEAAACGVPAVGTPVGVLPEVGGLPAAGAAALAETLANLLADDSRRQALGRAAYAQVASHYTLAAARHRFDRLYAEILASPT